MHTTSLLLGPTAVQGMWSFISTKLLEAIGIEPDPDILAVMMDSLCKVLFYIYTSTCIIIL